MTAHSDKRTAFRGLHHQDKAFVIPNPWDPGSTKLFTSLGFEALATTSAGFAFSQGLADNHVSRAAMFEHIQTLVEATHLPLSADLENAYGDSAAAVADTFSFALKVGLAGASIEDASGKPAPKVYPLAIARERVEAAVETVKGTGFVVTARAENYLCGNADLKDTIERLQAFQEAGADVLYAPGLSRLDEIATLVRSVDRPVNVVMGLQGHNYSVAELSGVGVKRISVGSALARHAFAATQSAALEILRLGTFNFAKAAMPFAELQNLMARDLLGEQR